MGQLGSLVKKSLDQELQQEEDTPVEEPKREIEYLKLSARTAQPNLERDLENDPRYKVLGIPHLAAFNRPVGLGAGIVGVIMLSNQFSRRSNIPFIPLYVLIIIGGYYVGSFADNVHKTRRLQDDLIVWDYVRRHPEDFPEVFERTKKIGDLILPWQPRRK